MLMWSNSRPMVYFTIMLMQKPANLLWRMLAIGLLAGWQASAAEKPASTNAAAPAAAAAAPAAAADAAAAPAKKPADLFDSVIAKGKGVQIKRSELDDAMVSIRSAAMARGQSIPPEQLSMIEQQILERLIQIQLLMSKATDADKTVGKESTEKRLESIKARAKTEENLNRQLKSMGTSMEQLRAKMNEEATAENVLERELKIVVKDEDVKKFYEDNPAKFEQPEMV